MNLLSLADKLKERLKLPLPGSLAHEPLRAVPVGKDTPNFEHKLPPKPGSVLILLYEENGILKFPLIKRPVYTGAHSGQVSFPGGKAEEGESAIVTALREGEEEIGIDRNEIDVVGTLSNFFVIPSNFMVTPVIGMARNVPRFKPDAFEVDRILIGTLDAIIDQNAISTKEILVNGRFTLNAPHFVIENEIVWGATAMMLNEFREVLLDIVKDRQ